MPLLQSDTNVVQSRKRLQTSPGWVKILHSHKSKTQYPSLLQFPQGIRKHSGLRSKVESCGICTHFLGVTPNPYHCQLSWEQNYFSLAGPPISVAVESKGGNLHFSLQKEKLFPMVLLLKYSFASFIDLRKFFIYKKGISKPQTHRRNYKLPILTIFIASFLIFEAFSSKYHLLECCDYVKTPIFLSFKQKGSNLPALMDVDRSIKI